MELKPGYKQTEVGVIPDDWEVKRLGKVVDFYSGKPLEGHVRTDGRYQLITLDSIDITGSLKSIHKRTNVWDSSLSKGDIVAVLSDLAHGYLLGLCDLIPDDGAYVLNQRMGRLRVTGDAEPSYIRLQINRAQPYFRQRGQGTSQRHIYRRDFDSLIIPLPPLAEQKAIAEALSDMDSLLSGLDSLIAKKRDIKQATMQQLLTGKTRLPGFSGEWEVKRLGEVLRVRHGKSQHEVVTSDGVYPILASGGEIGRTNAYLYNQPSVLIGRKGTIDSPQYVETPFWTVDTLFFTEIEPEACPKFVFYKFKMIPWRSYNEASGVPSLNAKTIESIDVNVPPLPEQQAIAKVLTDMDAELEALEQRRDKTRELKQAMMQELLTGRTRLV